MARQNVFNLRLSDEEFQRLKDYAASKQVSPAEVLRDYIKRLPRKLEDGSR
ncbi:MAG: DNA-binding protein [Cyanobacteria bacterium CRU_2_1]|nr:DNA-binding protein [Cyanobacteria bacterium CRU_2_1]